jgi:PII-like signaling protein
MTEGEPQANDISSRQGISDGITGMRLMIYLTEEDRLHHRGVHEELFARARQDGINGTSVWRAIEGFGRSGHARSSRFPDSVVGLPIVIELIDDKQQIETFLPVVRQLAPNALVTTESVQILGRHNKPSP